MNKKQWIKKLKPYWNEYLKIENTFNEQVEALEKRMREKTKDEDIEFAYNKMGGIELFFGIGFGRLSEPKRKPLLQARDFEK